MVNVARLATGFNDTFSHVGKAADWWKMIASARVSENGMVRFTAQVGSHDIRSAALVLPLADGESVWALVERVGQVLKYSEETGRG